jgi:ABC-type dipeptide/oligopeptide/nickel transport system permease component
MLRHALRRLLWIVPILIGVTLTSFALLSYAPDPADDPAVLSSLPEEQATELRRSRFLDLPRFFNDRPVDLAERARGALAKLATGGEGAGSAAALLVRLGGAAFPFLLPRLDALEPPARSRVAVALAPIAQRMGIESDEPSDPARAVSFWHRFWADRSVEFRSANAYRSARRFALHATDARQNELLELDTFALPATMDLLEQLSRSAHFEQLAGADRVHAIEALVEAAAHVTERDDRVPGTADEQQALACARRWREWWLAHESDYTAYTGMRRLSAMVRDTQYAKWAHQVLVLGFGAGSESSPVLERLRDRAGTTLAIVGGALASAYAWVLGAGLLRALRRGAIFRAGVLVASLFAFAVPTACWSIWLVARTRPGVAAAVVVLSLSLIASPLAQLRAMVESEERRDHVRAARALGFGTLAIWARQTLRSALIPLVAVASVELPIALGGAFVVEKAFGLNGLGEETVRAVQAHDVAWLVALVFVTALAVTLTSILADLATAAIDPRLSLAALRNQRTPE